MGNIFRVVGWEHPPKKKEGLVEIERVELLQKEKDELEKEVAKIRRESERQKTEFNTHVQKACEIVERSQQNGNKVVVLLGGTGSGKTTICHYLLRIPEATPTNGCAHGTTELTCFSSERLEYPVVDTVGRVPDTRGIMRVLACVYNKGWDPVGIIVVHTGRLGHFEALARLLHVSKINVLQFEPKSFWRVLSSGHMETKLALNLTINPSQGDDSLPHVHDIFVPENEEETIPYAECHISDNLIPILSELNWDTHVGASEDVGISNSLAFYLAKCISQRSKYGGQDMEFIDRE